LEGSYETADDAWVYNDFFTFMEITDDYIKKDQIPNKGRRTRSKAKEEPINDVAK